MSENGMKPNVKLISPHLFKIQNHFVDDHATPVLIQCEILISNEGKKNKNWSLIKCDESCVKANPPEEKLW